METTTIWQETMYVKASETDFQKRLKLSNFFVWMQNAAANHANHLGFGYDDLLKREVAWVLSRIKVKFFAFPEMGEQVTVQTWPKGIQQKLFFMRDYHLLDGSGRIYASATSAYVLVSASARRIVLPNALEVPVPDNGGLNAINEPLDKIPAAAELSECYTTQAGYSVIDIMNHVNNARYIDWISDCFSLEEYQAHPPAWLQINYLNEVKPGERVTMLRGRRPGAANTWYITGVNQNTGAKAFEAELG